MIGTSHRHALPSLVVVTALLCSGATCLTPPPVPVPPPNGSAAAWEDMIDAYVDYFERCQRVTLEQQLGAFAIEMDPDVIGEVPSRDELERQIRPFVESFRDNPNIARSGTFGACVDALRTASCNTGPTGCQVPFRGLARDGDRCLLSLECDEGVCAGGDSSTSCGVCRALPTDGEPCTGQCTSGSFCNFQHNTCERLRDVGELCNEGESCVAGAFCDGQRCQAPPGEGERCDFTGFCSDGLECRWQFDDVNGIEKALCEPAGGPTQPVAGDACNEGWECGDPLRSGVFCATEGNERRCRDIALVDEGAPCDGPGFGETGEAWCRFGFTRTECRLKEEVPNRTCEALPGVGAPCPEGRCRLDEALCAFPPNGGEPSCVPAPQKGEPCNFNGFEAACGLGLQCRSVGASSRCEPMLLPPSPSVLPFERCRL